MTQQKKWREKIDDLPPRLETEILQVVQRLLEKHASNDPIVSLREKIDQATLAAFPEAPTSISVERQSAGEYLETLKITFSPSNNRDAPVEIEWNSIVVTLLNHMALRAGLKPFNGGFFPQRPPENETEAKNNAAFERRLYQLSLAPNVASLQYYDTKREDLLAAVQSRLEELEQVERYRKNDALGTISDRHKWPASDTRSR